MTLDKTAQPRLPRPTGIARFGPQAALWLAAAGMAAALAIALFLR